MKILVLGSRGQLGQCLNDQLAITEHDVVYTSREQIDVAEFEVTKVQMLEISPDIVINATAYTAVDKAEKEQEVADRINHLAVANITSVCIQLDCWLIHVSTDYVFDGSSEVPYKEDNPTNPQGVYGCSKLKGELAIQKSGCKYLILRTAWVFSEYGNNFLKTILRIGSINSNIDVVSDQIGSPTYAQDIAKAIVKIIPSLSSSLNVAGIYHFCGDHPCSWYDFAFAIFEVASHGEPETPATVNPLTTEEYPTLAKRPPYSVLNCSKIYDVFGVDSSNWQAGVISVISKLNAKT